MKELQKIIEQKIKSRPEGISEEINNLYENVCGGGKNLEKILEILYAKRKYLAEIYDTNQQTKNDVNTLIAYIEESIYKEVNVNDCKIKESLRIYKEFYQKIARALTKDTRERFYICIQIVFVIMQVVIKP